MSNTMTLTQLQTAVFQRADMVNTTFVTTAEVTSYINQSYFELYDLLIQVYGDDYYVAPPTQFSTNGTSFLYPLPDGNTSFINGQTGESYTAPAFYKLLGLDLELANQIDSFITLKSFMFQDRNRYAVPNFQSFYGVTNLRYRLQGNNLWLTPIPAAGQTLQLWYIPQLTPLVNGSDVADNISGWCEYIICDAAIKCMQKEESDCSVLIKQKEDLIMRIQSAAENRNAGDPPRVTDTQYNDFWWPSGSGNGDGSGAF